MWIGFFGSISRQPILHSSLRLNGIRTIFQIWENTSSIFCNLRTSLKEHIFWITYSIRIGNSVRDSSNCFAFHFSSWLRKSSRSIILFTDIPHLSVSSITLKLTSIPSIRSSIPSLSRVLGIWDCWNTGSCIRFTRISIFMESRITILESTSTIGPSGSIKGFFSTSIGKSTGFCFLFTHSVIYYLMSLTSRSWRCRRRWRGDWWSWCWNYGGIWFNWIFGVIWSRSWCWCWSDWSLWLTFISYFLVSSITRFYFTHSPSIRCGVPYLFSTSIGHSTRLLVIYTRISFFVEFRITVLYFT